jgi:hypothetical protein
VILTAGKKSVLEYARICKGIILKQKVNGPIFIIGYSLGGLITRVLVEMLQIDAQAVILVGTPNKGIKLNCWEKLILWGKLILKILKRPAIEEMLPNSQFLRKLNENYPKLQLKTKYYLIAGQKDKRVPLNSALGIEGKKIIIPQCDHSGLIPKKPTSKPNAIGAIINILKEEVLRLTSSFLLEKMVKLNRSQPKLKIGVFI